MNPGNDNVQKALRVIGPLVIVVGIVLIVLGFVSNSAGERELEAQRNAWWQGRGRFEDINVSKPAQGFWLIALGGFAAVIGLGLTAFGFQQALLRYQARQYSPVVKEVLQDVAPNLAQTLGSTPAKPGVTCPACHAENAPDARFCSNCGAALDQPVACPSCGRRNEPGARFCIHCGQPLGAAGGRS